MTSIHAFFARMGLIRDTERRKLGGVCSGLARRFGVDPWAVRLLVILLLFALPGSQLLVYPIVWLLLPDEARAAQLTGGLPHQQLNGPAAAGPDLNNPAA